ncbi:MAG: hypothetical protein J6K12_02825 [Clostridia bacterium]|nr:hypothetical protein [Clostridia bacterium]
MSFKIYPITETELNYDGYEIKVNGVKVQPDTARVSAMPFNRRWPGHQRSADQTELINFLSLETDEALTFEIKPKESFENVIIRPLSLGIEPEITDDGRIIFTMEKASYFTVEPYGRHNALHIFADPVCDYDICKDDENVLYFGKGEHDVGMIHLKSNQTLFIDEGAVVYACVRAVDADNIKILGRGILDNSRNKAQILYEENAENNTVAINNAVRLHTVQLEYCNNIKIEGITMRDSLVYNIRPVGCKDVDISNVKIIGCWRYNSDGIDMHNCINVNIDNCFIRTFDDSICIKGFDCYYAEDVEKAVREAMYRNGKSYDIFKNVSIKNCVIWNDWGKCLEIGAETRAEEIYDIEFDSCDVIHVTGSALDCMNVDYADVHDVVYRNINVEYDDVIPTPLIQNSNAHKYENVNLNFSPNLIEVDVSFHPEYSAGGERRGKNRNILFENIRLFGRHQPKLSFTGYSSENCVSDITVKELYLNNVLMKEQELKIHKNEFCKNLKILP